MPLAKEFIKRFAEAGADWIKFQYTRVKHLRPDDPQYAWFTQSELQDEQFAELKQATEAAGAKFLLTVYNYQDVPAVATLSTEAIKIGSGETFDHRLDAALRTYSGHRHLRSVATVAEPGWYVRTKDLPGELLACVPWYPASPRAAEHAISTIGYYAMTGYSDHCVGIDLAKWAIERGARIIEKHCQIPNQARPCKLFEATVEEFTALRTFADQHPDRFLGRWQYA